MNPSKFYVIARSEDEAVDAYECGDYYDSKEAAKASLEEASDENAEDFRVFVIKISAEEIED